MLSGTDEKAEDIRILSDWTFKDFLARNQRWFQTGRFLWFINGNISKEDAIEIATYGKTTFNVKPTRKQNLNDVRPISIRHKTSHLIEQPLITESDDNSCIFSYFQVGLEDSDIKTKMLNDLLVHLIENPSYDQLRTKE